MSSIIQIQMIKGGVGEFFRLKDIVDSFPDCPIQDIWGLCPVLDEIIKGTAANPEMLEKAKKALKLSTIYLN